MWKFEGQVRHITTRYTCRENLRLGYKADRRRMSGFRRPPLAIKAQAGGETNLLSRFLIESAMRGSSDRGRGDEGDGSSRVLIGGFQNLQLASLEDVPNCGDP